MRQTILLDALGTLVELEDPVPLLVAELAQRGVKITRPQARKALDAEIDYYREHILDAGTRRGLADLRERCTAVLGVELPPHARIVGLQEVLLASLRFKPYPEVAGTLGVLRARGHRLVVVSNWDISLNDHLKAVGLAHLVDGVVVSAQRGVQKPDPLLFAAALAEAGTTAADAMHVGDDLRADVQGAIDARIEPVWLDRHGSGPAPEGVRRITSLRDLLEPAT